MGHVTLYALLSFKNTWLTDVTIKLIVWPLTIKAIITSRLGASFWIHHAFTFLARVEYKSNNTIMHYKF